jgi:hypothetical protein
MPWEGEKVVEGDMLMRIENNVEEVRDIIH